ncbi:MAG: UV DNA damage endonuclease [Verrucomicrobiae bacterium]|nr:UV DNA damage endonuclease [Verrucomicrobiae bacterium]
MRKNEWRGIRLGLCCQFAREPIKFRTTTATAMLRLSRRDRLARLGELCRSNAAALLAAVRYCAGHGFGAFRVNSQILPVKTHPQAGYDMRELPAGGDIIARFRECGELARAHDIRLSFHPDQFVVLNSPNVTTLAHSLAELDYQAEVASWIGADTINIHGGGAYGDKPAALRTLRKNINRLPAVVRSRLTLENDDKIYTPADLLPVCEDTAVPLVYDVHHHRCLPDGLSIEAATARARATWNCEPVVHLSSPLDGWRGPRPERHHDYIEPRDFPSAWKRLKLTVEVEAKAKELAVTRLLEWLRSGAC